MLNFQQLQAIVKLLELDINTLSVGTLNDKLVLSFTTNISKWRCAQVLEWDEGKRNAYVTGEVSHAIGFGVGVKLSAALSGVWLEVTL